MSDETSPTMVMSRLIRAAARPAGGPADGPSTTSPLDALRSLEDRRNKALAAGERRAAVQAQVEIEDLLDQARARADSERDKTAAGHAIASDAGAGAQLRQAGPSMNDLIRAAR